MEGYAGLIYNSRNYSILLNSTTAPAPTISTTVEIILYYLTQLEALASDSIYNSRNYSILLNMQGVKKAYMLSTTVEIILYYLTDFET